VIACPIDDCLNDRKHQEWYVRWYVKWRTSNGIVPAVRCDESSKVSEIYDQMDTADRNPWIEDHLGRAVPRREFPER